MLNSSTQGSNVSTRAAENEALRSTRIYQIMLVAHELVLEGKDARSTNALEASSCHVICYRG